MKFTRELLDQFRVKPGKKLKLKDFDSDWEGDKDIPRSERKAKAAEILEEDIAELAAAQELLYASDTWSLLVIFQAMDAAGKDSTIKHVMSGVNPQGCQVYSFKHPSTEELDHDFLWRCMKVLPERGRIGIFNRSYYEEVLIVKVHPEFVKAQRIPNAEPSKKFWEGRYESINHFEEHLTRNGTAIVKFYLNVSQEVQHKRFLERIEDSSKHWKFNAGDLAESELWDQYREAYEDCMTATSSEQAPWYVIPADHKWITRALVSRILVQKINSLNLRWPEVTEEQRNQIAAAKAKLLAEKK